MSNEAEKANERLGNLDGLDPVLQERLKQLSQGTCEPENKRLLPNGMTVWYHYRDDAPYLSVKLAMNKRDNPLGEDEGHSQHILAVLEAHLISHPMKDMKKLSCDIKELGYNVFVHVGNGQIDLESPYVQNEKIDDVLQLYADNIQSTEVYGRLDYYKERLTRIMAGSKNILDGVTQDNIGDVLQFMGNPQNMTLTIRGNLVPDLMWSKIERSALAQLKPTDKMLPTSAKAMSEKETATKRTPSPWSMHNDDR